MIRPRTTPTCGPLWRVPLDERGKIRIRDDAGVLHKLRSAGSLHDMAITFGGGDRQAIARLRAERLARDPTMPLWAYRIMLGFMLVLGGASCLFFLWKAAQQVGSLLPAAIMAGPLALMVWLLRRSGQRALDRRSQFFTVSRRLLEGHCGVCDYQLVSAPAPSQTLCSECSATWDVDAWRASFVLPTSDAKADALQAVFHAAAAARQGKPVDATRAKVFASTSRWQSKRYWGQELRRFLRRPSLTVLLLLGVMAASPWIWPIIALGAQTPGDAIVVQMFALVLPLLFASLLMCVTIVERAVARVHADRRRRNCCEHCDEPLEMVPCHADRTIVCPDCGGRRSLDLPTSTS
jgi:hypothetical protein